MRLVCARHMQCCMDCRGEEEEEAEEEEEEEEEKERERESSSSSSNEIFARIDLHTLALECV